MNEAPNSEDPFKLHDVTVLDDEIEKRGLTEEVSQETERRLAEVRSNRSEQSNEEIQ